MTIKIDAKFFTQANKVFSGRAEDGLTAAIRAVMQAQAKIAASAVTALTDSSGGAGANGTIEAIGNFTKAVLGSTDAAQKAELEAGLANVTDGIKELIAQCNSLHAKVPALDGTLVDNIVGTAVDGTINAIDVSYTGVAASMASAAGARIVMTGIVKALSQLRYHANKLAVACGVTPLVDNLGVADNYSLTFVDIPEGTGTAASGSDTTDANAIIKATDAGNIMQLAANAVKEIATVLNACRSTTGGTMGAVAA